MTEIPTDGTHITYQQQYRKCGKDYCSACRNGPGHGKYWYAYWREGSRLRSAYVGKIHPDDHASVDTDNRTKLTREDVLDIRARIAGGERVTDIAVLKGVRQSTISNIKRGATWKDVHP